MTIHIITSRQRAHALYDEQYRHDAEWEGDKRPKRDSASVRRSAREIDIAAQKLKLLLSDEEAKVLFRAASILRTLAGDIESVATIAKAAKRNRERQELKVRHDKADLVAAARWASDEAMRFEAADLAAFVDQAAMRDLLRWVLSIHPGSKSAYVTKHIPHGLRLCDMLKVANGRVDVVAVKRRAAEYVVGLEAAQRDSRERSDGRWQVGLDDYEAWRELRRQAYAAIPSP